MTREIHHALSALACEVCDRVADGISADSGRRLCVECAEVEGLCGGESTPLARAERRCAKLADIGRGIEALTEPIARQDAALRALGKERRG